jgi:hypothetical protein
VPGDRDYGQPELKSSVTDADVKFKIVERSVNEYLTESGLRFKLELELTNVSKTSKLDRDGIPIYIVDTKTKVELDS